MGYKYFSTNSRILLDQTIERDPCFCESVQVLFISCSFPMKKKPRPRPSKQKIRTAQLSLTVALLKNVEA